MGSFYWLLDCFLNVRTSSRVRWSFPVVIVPADETAEEEALPPGGGETRFVSR